jgi:conjugal transfer ATP-binding protein TraC
MKDRDSSLAEELPYWEFVDGNTPHIVLQDGSLTGGLRASLIDIECFDDGEVNRLTENLRSALNSVSEGSRLQFFFSTKSDSSDLIERHIQGKSNEPHPLIESVFKLREEGLRQAQERAEFYRPELTIFLRIPKPKKNGVFALAKEHHFEAVASQTYQDTLDSLSQNMEALKSSLATCGMKTDLLSRENLIQIAYRFLNPKRSESEPPPTLIPATDPDLDLEIRKTKDWLSNSSPREQLVYGDLILGFEQYTLDSRHHRVISLKTMPEITFAGQLSQFLRMPFHYDLLVTVDVPFQMGEMAKLNQKRKMAHALATTQSGKASDLESETKLSSTEELIRELLSTGQRIYACQLSVILREEGTIQGTHALNQNTRQVLARLRALQGAEGLEESVGAWKIVKGNLPGAPVAMERARKVKTNSLADFLPVYAPREGDKDPVVLFRNRLGGLRGYDPFDGGLPNYNTLVTGSSGAGKSFLNNCILLQELAREMRVFIIDIGGSYRKLTQSLGGQYFELTLADAYRLNPFDIPDIEKGPSDQKLKSLLATIECMVAEDGGTKLPKLDRVLLESSLTELYKAKQKTNEIPVLSDLEKMLSKSDEPTLKRVAKMLSMWIGESPYGKLLDGQGKLRTDGMICTFDLKGLSNHPDLQSVMILILTDFILTQVESDKTSRKRIILDDAWELLKSPAAASFMEYCARTLRKTGSGITFITQGVEEIVASPIGSAILNNTATKFILLQRGDPQILRNTLKLNAQELNLIQSLEQKKGKYSEAFMIEGDHRQVVRVKPGPFEYWISTSDSRDNAYLEKLVAGGESLVSAIELAADLYPLGVNA